MAIPSNYTDIKFGIQNNAERYSWAAYFLFGILSSLIGDTLILFASLQHAFRIKKFLVPIIQHIALSDLGYVIFGGIPIAASLLANSWPLGTTLCYVRVYTAYSIYLSGMSLIAVLTTSKFLILRYPLRAGSWSTTRAHQVCSLIWASLLTIPILFLAVDKDDVEFDYRIYTCRYRYSSEIWKTMIPITGFIFGFAPNAVILVTTVPILKYLVHAWKSARRVKGSIPWQGAFTVAVTSVVYCCSSFLYVVHRIVNTFIDEHPPGLFQVQFYRICHFLLMINVVANFFIYISTIKSFRTFLLVKLRPIKQMPKSTSLRTSRNIEPSSSSGKIRI